MHTRIGVTDQGSNSTAQDALATTQRVVFTSPSDSDRARARWGTGIVVAVPETGEVVSRADGIAIVAAPAARLHALIAEIPDPLVVVVVLEGDPPPALLLLSSRFAVVRSYPGCCYSISCRFGQATVIELSRRVEEQVEESIEEPIAEHVEEHVEEQVEESIEELIAEHVEEHVEEPIAESIPARLRRRRDRGGSSR